MRSVMPCANPNEENAAYLLSFFHHLSKSASLIANTFTLRRRYNVGALAERLEGTLPLRTTGARNRIPQDSA
jgi:hypothetical protein